MTIVQDLAGRVAVVTGASSGMGRASALLLAARGAKVALLARRETALNALAAEIRAAGGMALPIVTNVTNQESVNAAAAAVLSQFGAADLVFNNAGVMLPGAIGQQPFSEWEQQIDLNVTGAMRVIQAFVPQLETSAAQGKVVDLINTSSIAGQYVYGYFAVYSATKAYVSHLTRHLRLELGPKNIRVAMIEPGITDTELQGHFTFQGRHGLDRQCPHDHGLPEGRRHCPGRGIPGLPAQAREPSAGRDHAHEGRHLSTLN